MLEQARPGTSGRKGRGGPAGGGSEERQALGPQAEAAAEHGRDDGRVRDERDGAPARRVRGRCGTVPDAAGALPELRQRLGGALRLRRDLRWRGQGRSVGQRAQACDFHVCMRA